MALQKVTGQKVAVSATPMRSESIDPPEIVIREKGEAIFKLLALRLLGVTSIWTPESAESIINAAAAIQDGPTYEWTCEDAERILAVAGAAPSPAHVRYWTLKGQGIVLLQAVPDTVPGAKKLHYPKHSKAPRISLLSVLREENITVPRGMALHVPVKLMDDPDGLVLAAPLRLGTLREVTDESGSDSQQATKPTTK